MAPTLIKARSVLNHQATAVFVRAVKLHTGYCCRTEPLRQTEFNSTLSCAVYMHLAHAYGKKIGESVSYFQTSAAPISTRQPFSLLFFLQREGKRGRLSSMYSTYIHACACCYAASHVAGPVVAERGGGCCLYPPVGYTLSEDAKM